MKKAKERMRKRPARFVVGYLGGGNIVFGRVPCKPVGWHWTDAAEPMTRQQAKRFLATMPAKGAAIFELSPVEVR